MLGRGHEPARDRRLGGPRAGLFGSAADGLEPGLVAAGGQFGQHPLHRELVQQLGRGKRCPCRQRQLPDTVGAAYPRPVDPDAAAAEVTLPGWLPWRTATRSGWWRPLGPTSRSTSASSRLPSTPRPVPTASASRPSRAAPTSSASATVTCSGSTSSASAGTVECVSFGMWRSPSGRAAWSLPDTYHTAGHRAGTATSSSTKPGTTSTSRRCLADLVGG